MLEMSARPVGRSEPSVASADCGRMETTRTRTRQPCHVSWREHDLCSSAPVRGEDDASRREFSDEEVEEEISISSR